MIFLHHAAAFCLLTCRINWSRALQVISFAIDMYSVVEAGRQTCRAVLPTVTVWPPAKALLHTSRQQAAVDRAARS